jgi:radical SAM superfamily enzyme YgiQ (UPF0313 family)
MQKDIKKILLVSPPNENTLKFFPGSYQLEPEDIGVFPPLGLFYLQSVLEQKFSNIQVDVLDTLLLKMSHEGARKYLQEHRPDIVGISSFTISWKDVLKFVRIVKKELPEAIIILGGPHTFEYPKETLEHKEIDAIFVGESEESLAVFVERVISGGNINDIKGVYTRENVANYRKTDMTVIENLDALPFLKLSNFLNKGYSSNVASEKNVYVMICSRGCPYSCTFCNTMYKRYRGRSIENIMKEVQRAYDAGFREIFFFDDTFNITKERVQEASKAILNANLKIKWTFRGRVNVLDEETIALAKKSGLRQMHIGIETGTDEGLAELKKGITVEQVKNVIFWARKHGVKVIGDFMMGLPFEKSAEDVKDNIYRLIEMDPDFAQVSVLEPYPGTAIFEQGLAKGLFSRAVWDEFIRNPFQDFIPPIWNEYLRREELAKLNLWAYKKFYFRTRVIWRHLKKVESVYDFWAKFKGAVSLLLPR